MSLRINQKNIAMAFAILLLTAAVAVGQTTGTGTGTGTGTTGTGNSAQTQFSGIQSALGLTGQVSTSGVWKAEFTRTDIAQVTLDTSAIQSNLVANGIVTVFPLLSASTGTTGTTIGTTGTTTSAAGPAGVATALVTAEIPLQESELKNFEAAWQQSGLDISAIHNHEALENPRLIFVHIEQPGDPTQIGQAIAKGLIVGTIKESTDDNSSPTERAQLQAAFWSNAQIRSESGVVDVQVPRPEQFTNCSAAIYDARANASGTTTSSGTPTGTGASTLPNAAANAANNACLLGALQPSAGATSAPAANQNVVPAEALGAIFEFRFQPTSGGNALVTAELPLQVTEVNSVIRALQKAGFTISAVHNHTLGESPRLLFVHADATGSIQTLASALRSAIDANGIFVTTSTGTGTATTP